MQASRSKDEAHKNSSHPVVRSANTVNNNNNNNKGIHDNRPATATGESSNRLPRTLLAETSAPLSHVTSTEVRLVPGSVGHTLSRRGMKTPYHLPGYFYSVPG